MKEAFTKPREELTGINSGAGCLDLRSISGFAAQHSRRMTNDGSPAWRSHVSLLRLGATHLPSLSPKRFSLHVLPALVNDNFEGCEEVGWGVAGEIR